MSNQAVEKNKAVAVKKGTNPIQAFQQEVNNLFQSFFGETLPHWWRASEACLPFGICPATDIVETDKEIKVTAELPGLAAKDITVSVNDSFVTIQGKKDEEKKEERKGYFRQERSYGEFQRVIALPDHADMEHAQAEMSNGVLTVTLPKKAGVQPKTRQISVKQAA